MSHIVTVTTGSRPVGIARIAVAGAALVKICILSGPIWMLAGPEALRIPMVEAVPAVPGTLLRVLIPLWIGAAFAFLLGWRTRWAGAVLTGTMLAALLGDQQLYSNHLYLLTLAAGLLTLADCGAALSLDARRRRPRERVPAWPVTLLKLQLSIVYGIGALAKLNAVYLSGAVLNAHMGRGSILPFPEELRTVEIMAGLALASVMAETFLAIGVWSRRWRPAAFGLGLAFHAVIVLTMAPALELVVFAVVMFALYLLHLDAPPGSRVVVWDDACAFCGGWIRVLRRLDWLRVHRFVGGSGPEALPGGITRAEADEAIQLAGPDGRAAGFDAITRMLEVLPVSFLWAPYLRNRWIRGLGDRAYRAVATRRRCGLRPRVGRT